MMEENTQIQGRLLRFSLVHITALKRRNSNQCQYGDKLKEGGYDSIPLICNHPIKLYHDSVVQFVSSGSINTMFSARRSTAASQTGAGLSQTLQYGVLWLHESSDGFASCLTGALAKRECFLSSFQV